MSALRTVLRRFAKARDGIAAVEFALILPARAVLYVGGFEVMQEVAVNRQVTLTASTVATIVSQYSNISASSTMPDILAASSAVLTPYSASNAVITVSCITIDNTGRATIAWSQSLHGTARTAGASITIPAALDVKNSTLILGETTYAYTPAVDYLNLGTMTVSSSIYMLPRQPGTITLGT